MTEQHPERASGGAAVIDSLVAHGVTNVFGSRGRTTWSSTATCRSPGSGTSSRDTSRGPATPQTATRA